MKYRVTTDKLANFNKGETISYIKEGDRYYSEDRHNLHGVTKEEIERNPDWFEKVDEFEVGDYVFSDNLDVLARIEDIDEFSIHRWAVDPINGSVGNWEKESDLRKATTEEIEQALIKEAKRRGFECATKWKPAYKTNVKYWAPCNHGLGFQYDPSRDELYYAGTCVYARGNWAEIIDEKQAPQIEINGYKTEFHDGYVKFGCRKISSQTIIDLYNLTSSGDIAICVSDGITDKFIPNYKIKQLANYVKKKT